MESIAYDIIIGQIRTYFAGMDYTEIINKKDKFIKGLIDLIGNEISQAGFKLININVLGITDS